MPRGEKTKLLWQNSDYRKKMSESHKGKIHEGSFKVGHTINVGREFSEERRLNISESLTGRKLTDEHRESLSIAKSGKRGNHHTAETRQKMSESAKRLVRSGVHNFWKGGVSEENSKIRKCVKYKLWREAVFGRDGYRCVWCGIAGGKWLKDQKRKVSLNADHIKPFAFFPELRFEVSNGRTLCYDCHKKTKTFGNNKKTL